MVVQSPVQVHLADNGSAEPSTGAPRRHAADKTEEIHNVKKKKEHHLKILALHETTTVTFCHDALFFGSLDRRHQRALSDKY